MKIFVVFAAVLACAYAKPGLVGYSGLGYPGLGYSGLGYSGLGYSGLGYAGLGGPVQYAGVPVQYAAAPAVQYAAAPAIQYAAAPAVHYAAAPAIVAPAFTKTQYHAQDELGQFSHGYAHPGQAAAETRDAFGNVRGSYAYVDPNGKEVRVNYVADAVNGFRVESNALPVGPSVPETPALIAPEPVQDTPEVVEARAAHARAVEAAGAAAAAAPESRKKRGIAYTYPALAAPALTYAVAPHSAFSYGYTAVHGPAYTTYAHAPVAVAAPAQVVVAAPAPVAYAAAPVAVAGPVVSAPAFREATLTKVVNNPGHAVSYRVD